MRLERVEIENFRAVERLELPLDPSLTVLHGANGDGKTSVLSAIAAGLGSIPTLLPEVAGVGFRKTDLRGQRPLRVALRTCDGIEWARHTPGKRKKAKTGPRPLKEAIDAIVAADLDGGQPRDLPIVAFYGTDRATPDTLPRRRGSGEEFSRYAALEGALSARTDFQGFFRWFRAKEDEELRAQKERRDFDHRLKELDAVRAAIEGMVPGVSDPRVALRPLRFVVSVQTGNGKPETLSLDQLSGGCRIMLALAADLARRMAQGNPHLADPLESEAVVLIDEVELHLHPGWQQRVLTDLARTFPNAQFVVSTHSPQALTTVRPEHVVHLYRDGGRIVAGQSAGPIYGAAAGDVLAVAMGVDERPADNEFVEALNEYMELVYGDCGESEKARELRRKLEALSPDDYGLDRADIEIRRRKVMRRMGKSP